MAIEYVPIIDALGNTRLIAVETHDGKEFQYARLVHGPDGVTPTVVADDAPLPVQQVFSDIVSSQKSVTTWVQLLASQLAGRRSVTIQNRGDVSIFIGKSANSITNTVEVYPGGSLTRPWGPAVVPYAGSLDGTTCDVRILEEK